MAWLQAGLGGTWWRVVAVCGVRAAAAGCCWPRVGRARTEVHTAARAATLHRRGRPGPARPHPCPGPAACTLLATTCSLLPPAPAPGLLQPPVLGTSNNHPGPLRWCGCLGLGLPAGLEAMLCVEALEMVKEGQKPTGLSMSMSTIFT